MAKRVNCFLIATLTICPGFVYPQTIPTNASSATNGKPFAWPGGATVNVYIDTTAFPQGSAQYNAVATGYAQAASANHAAYNVTFNIVPVAGCPANPQGYSLEVSSGNLGGQDYGLTNFTIGGLSTNGNYYTITSAVSYLDIPEIQTNTFLQGTADHEALHGFAEGDCPSCAPSVTPMSTQGSPSNPGAISPTNADVWTAGSAYFGGGE